MSTRSNLINEFPDNNSGQITPANLRDLVNSSVLPEDVTAGTGIIINKSGLPAITISTSVSTATLNQLLFSISSLTVTQPNGQDRNLAGTYTVASLPSNLTTILASQNQFQTFGNYAFYNGTFYLVYGSLYGTFSWIFSDVGTGNIYATSTPLLGLYTPVYFSDTPTVSWAGGGGGGASGYSGISGFSGYSGISGISGYSGYSGAGTSGASGVSGISGVSGYSGTSGYSGKSGYSGVSGYSGKGAVIQTDKGILRLVCVEMPEVRFEEIMVIKPTQNTHYIPIDPRFVSCCEKNSIIVVSAVASEQCQIGAKVIGDMVIISTNNLPQQITIKLSGIRIGCGGIRFQECSREQLESNDRFWGKQFTS